MSEPRPLNSPVRSRLTRRAFMGGAGLAGAGLALGPQLAMPVLADDEQAGGFSPRFFTASVSPNEIEHVNTVTTGAFSNKAHFFFPGPVEGTAAATDPEGAHPMGRDPSTIYDFKGVIGQTDIVNITGTGTDLNTGASARYTFHTDSRFMSGEFIGSDGRKHRGTFAEI
jgi:hypothetical protein